MRRRRAGREFSRNSHLGNPGGLPQQGPTGNTALQVNGISAEQAVPHQLTAFEPHRRVCCCTCVPGTQDSVTDGLALCLGPHAGKVAGMMLMHMHNLPGDQDCRKI